MSKKSQKQAFGPAICRIGDVMAHTSWYAFCGVSRLAKDAQVNASSLSRVLNGKTNPSFLMVARITAALERRLGIRLDPRDLIAESGVFRTSALCDVVGCPGCLPQQAYDEFSDLKPTYAGIKKGTWVTSRYPRGYQHAEQREEDHA